jgi:hypothetical protein
LKSFEVICRPQFIILMKNNEKMKKCNFIIFSNIFRFN